MDPSCSIVRLPELGFPNIHPLRFYFSLSLRYTLYRLGVVLGLPRGIDGLWRSPSFLSFLFLYGHGYNLCLWVYHPVHSNSTGGV